LSITKLTHKEEDKNCKTFGWKHGEVLVYPQLYA
jgi:Co/Zn/Cd efflux system component